MTNRNRGKGIGQRYFTEFTMVKGIFYGSAIVFVLAVSVAVTLEPIIPLVCNENRPDTSIDYINPSYLYYPCQHQRTWRLLGLTPEECDFGRRLVASVVMGGVIGWERRMADRPAGIRTMSLVSLASCLFTICSAFAFISGPMAWDSSRIAAAIPSGVGFLGAGLIFKEEGKDEITGLSHHVVHGLTTATTVWLSAAVGCACGGALYFVSVFSTFIMLVLLRFGPRHREFQDQPDEQGDQEGNVPARMRLLTYGTSGGGSIQRNDEAKETDPTVPGTDNASFRRNSTMTVSIRNRAALGTDL